MNIQSIKQALMPNFSEFQKKIMKVNFVTVLITFAMTLIFAILSLFANASISEKLVALLLSPLVAIALSIVVIAYMLVLCLINIFKVKSNKITDYFNMGSAYILLILQTLSILALFLTGILHSVLLKAILAMLASALVLVALFVIAANVLYAIGASIVKVVNKIRST